MKLGKVSNYVLCLFQWTSIPYSTVQCQGHRPDTFRLEKSNKVNFFQFFRGHYFVVDLHLPLLELGLHAIQFIWQIQGVSFEMALALKWFILDPMLKKPKCVWEFERKTFLQFWKLFTFFCCLFTIFPIYCQLSNAFWLYQHGVKYALFLCYSHLKCHFKQNNIMNRYWNFFVFKEKLNRIYSKAYIASITK